MDTQKTQYTCKENKEAFINGPNVNNCKNIYIAKDTYQCNKIYNDFDNSSNPKYQCIKISKNHYRKKNASSTFKMYSSSINSHSRPASLEGRLGKRILLQSSNFIEKLNLDRNWRNARCVAKSPTTVQPLQDSREPTQQRHLQG